VMTLMSVDLPAPFSPTRAWTSPALKSNETTLSARTPANDFEMSDSLRIVSKGEAHKSRQWPNVGWVEPRASPTIRIRWWGSLEARPTLQVSHPGPFGDRKSVV